MPLLLPHNRYSPPSSLYLLSPFSRTTLRANLTPSPPPFPSPHFLVTHVQYIVLPFLLTVSSLLTLTCEAQSSPSSPLFLALHLLKRSQY